MLRSCLFIFVIAIIILPIFSTAAAVPERSLNCYKYEKGFPDLNLVDPLLEEKEIVKCDQCFSYLCYANDEYIFGNGCRDDLLKSCPLGQTFKTNLLKSTNAEMCVLPIKQNIIMNFCLKNYCNSNNLPRCINTAIETSPNQKIGPEYTVANITFTQLTTPAPTTTTTPFPTTTKSAFNVDGQSDGNDRQNGEKNGPGGSQNEKSAASYNSVNSKMFLFAFFGIFMVAYFM